MSARFSISVATVAAAVQDILHSDTAQAADTESELQDTAVLGCRIVGELQELQLQHC